MTGGSPTAGKVKVSPDAQLTTPPTIRSTVCAGNAKQIYLGLGIGFKDTIPISVDRNEALMTPLSPRNGWRLEFGVVLVPLSQFITKHIRLEENFYL